MLLCDISVRSGSFSDSAAILLRLRSLSVTRISHGLMSWKDLDYRLLQAAAWSSLFRSRQCPRMRSTASSWRSSHGNVALSSRSSSSPFSNLLFRGLVRDP
ncbi:hypothetical protein SAY87_019490 [Trapa incisa]|uniref:Uncharacterized protein n=1 Tax=Trapa incisa TaxID=236973 RepID=A0AAN7K4J7_9MYRT|nr:hypothetical protein SAY87_019490 [Trapa incisa]